MKTVDVDDVLKILHRYSEYIFVTDDKKYSSMVDEIANLKGLKQEPHEDAVSREAVLDLCDSKDPDYKVIHFKEDVECLPPVTPQPKTGHWIGHREHCENLGVMPSGLGVYEWCSNCDCGIDVREWHKNHYNYCPNCGAKMQEVEE